MKAKKLGRTILLAILLAVLTTGAAFASEGDQIDVTGYIMAAQSRRWHHHDRC